MIISRSHIVNNGNFRDPTENCPTNRALVSDSRFLGICSRPVSSTSDILRFACKFYIFLYHFLISRSFRRRASKPLLELPLLLSSVLNPASETAPSIPRFQARISHSHPSCDTVPDQESGSRRFLHQTEATASYLPSKKFTAQ